MERHRWLCCQLPAGYVAVEQTSLVELDVWAFVYLYSTHGRVIRPRRREC